MRFTCVSAMMLSTTIIGFGGQL